MDGARARVEVLGPFCVRGPNGADHLGGGLAAALVALLASRLGQPIDRDELVAALWSTPRDDAGPALRQLVARARRVLPDGAIERAEAGGRTSYRLSPELVGVDLVDFERLLEEVRRTGGRDRASIRAALELVYGTPFSGLPNLDALEDARRFVEPHLAELRRAALIADAEECQPSLVPTLDTALDDAPDDEGLWTAKIRYLARTGRPAAAARAAARARQRLGEVGIEPGPSLREAERLALDLGSMTPFSPRALPSSPDLVGRLAERTDALTALLDGRTPLVTMWGAPGMGASSLLVAVANDAAAAGLAVVVVTTPTAAPPRSSAEIVEELASQIGWSSQDGDPRRWMSVVVPRGTALAVDVLGAPDDVTEAIRTIRDGWPGPVAVAAGRPTGLSGEHAVRLTALARADAVELLRRRTESLRGRRMADAEIDALDDVCERSGGIPLVIELVARQLATCTAADLLAGPIPSGLAERIEAIVSRLSEVERDVLHRIVWIGGPFDLVDACRTFPRPRPGVEVVRSALATLVEVGLVQFEDERPSSAYRMLAPITSVVRSSEPAKAVERSATRRRTLTLAGRGRGWGDALGRVERDGLARPMLLDRLPELVVAARDTSNPPSVRRALLRASTELMFAVGRAPEAQRILDQVVRSDADFGRFALDLVRTAYYLDDPARVVELVERSRTIELPLCDRLTVERAAVRSLRHMCRFAEAHELLDRLEGVVDPNSPVDPVLLRMERGMVLTLEDRCTEAADLLAEARVDWQALEADQAVGACDVYLSWCAWADGAHDRADELLGRAADVARRIGHESDVMFCRSTAVRFAAERGRYELALEESRDVEAYMRPARDQLGLVRLLEARSAAERGLGRGGEDAAFEAALIRRRMQAPVSPFERRFTGGERLLTIAGS